jgi:hypothetical protein
MFQSDLRNIKIFDRLKPIKYISENNIGKLVFSEKNEKIVTPFKKVKKIKKPYCYKNDKEYESFAIRSRKRKCKSSNELRNYKCWCGKAYFSNAALYTHNKLKHIDEFSKNFSPTNSNRKIKLPDSISDKIIAFNYKLIKYISEFDKKSFIRKKDIDLINFFPCYFFTKQSLFSQIMINVEKIRNEMNRKFGSKFFKKFHIFLNQVSNINSLNCNNIFALFIINVFEYVSLSFFKEVIFLLICLKEHLNEKGWEKYTDYGDKEKVEFCNLHTAEFIPDFFNSFVFDFLEKCFTNGYILKDNQLLTFFGIESPKLLRVIDFLKLFGEWLKIFSFTTATVRFLAFQS